MRWHIIRTLLLKELLLHLADRGAIFLALLLLGASLIITLFGKEDVQGVALIGGVKACYVDYWEAGPWIEHLQTHPPKEQLNVRFRPVESFLSRPDELIVYPQNAGAIQIRVNGQDEQGQTRYLIWLWHAGDPAALAPYLDWFWKETLHYYQLSGRAIEIETAQDQVIYPGESALIHVQAGAPAAQEGDRPRKKYLYWRPDDDGRVRALIEGKRLVELEVKSDQLRGRSSLRSSVGTALVIFAICFFSIYLMPCLTCEERERGVLLAQVLSPASTGEILAAKFLFYPTLGMMLGVLLAGIFEVQVLLRPFFWLGLVTTAVGYLGVGLTIASLARTQRMASMGAMCYMLTLAMLLYISSQFDIPLVNYLALEYYCPRVIHAALVGTIQPYRWNLAAAMILAAAWNYAAIRLFRERGWQ